MAPDIRIWRIKTAVTLSVVVLPLACLENSAAQAQAIMRSPSINVGSRVTTINPTVAPRINPNIAGNAIARTPSPQVNVTTIRSVPRISVPRIGVRSTLPYLRYSPNLYPACEYANRGSDGECFDRPVALTGGGGGNRASAKNSTGGARGNSPQTAIDLRTVRNEFVAEIDSAVR